MFDFEIQIDETVEFFEWELMEELEHEEEI